MKIHELIAELQRFNPEWEAVMHYGPDSEDVDPVFDLGQGWYDTEERSFTPLILEIDTPDERLYRDRKRSECNAVALFL